MRLNGNGNGNGNDNGTDRRELNMTLHVVALWAWSLACTCCSNRVARSYYSTLPYSTVDSYLPINGNCANQKRGINWKLGPIPYLKYLKVDG